MIAVISHNRHCAVIALSLCCLISTQGFSQTHTDDTKALDLAHAAQLNQSYNLVSQRTTFPPDGVNSFFDKEGIKGSQYLAKHWLAGAVQFNGNGFLPEQDSLGFNFDKINNQLVVTRDGQKTLTVAGDHILSFILADSTHVYQFEKLPMIAPNEFFQILVKAPDKYSLYRHIQTKMHEADYNTVGYASYGKKYDEIVDTYTYFIILPDGHNFKRVNLNKHSIHSAFPDKTKEIDDFFAHQDSQITEATLSQLIGTFNGKQ